LSPSGVTPAYSGLPLRFQALGLGGEGPRGRIGGTAPLLPRGATARGYDQPGSCQAGVSQSAGAPSPLSPRVSPPRSLGRGRVAASAGFSGLGSVFLRFPFHAKTGFGKPCRARSLLLVLLFSLFVCLLSCRIHLGLECLQIISLLARPPSETKGRTKMKPDLRN
jgi:hypothetical protein